MLARNVKQTCSRALASSHSWPPAFFVCFHDKKLVRFAAKNSATPYKNMTSFARSRVSSLYNICGLLVYYHSALLKCANKDESNPLVEQKDLQLLYVYMQQCWTRSVW
jgi:hypothetical protein